VESDCFESQFWVLLLRSWYSQR